MRIGSKQGLYNKLVYEVRYQHGMVYLDRCGTIVNRITMTYPDWVVKEAPNPQNAPMLHTLSGIQFNFGALKYDFSLDQSVDQVLTDVDVETFIEQAARLAGIVHEELELTSFLREGFRIWYIFDMESEDEANRWIRDLGVFDVSHAVPDAFHGTIEAASHTVIINTSERKYRISVNTAERLERLDLPNLSVLPRSLPRRQREALLEQMRSKQRLRLNPQYVVAIDVDAYVEEPIEVVPQDFLEQSFATINARLPKALERGVIR